MDNRVILVSPVEELAVAAHRLDALHQQVEIAFLLDEIEPLGVYDQHRYPAEMVEKAVVAVRQQSEVLGGYRPLEFYAAPAYALDERLRLRLEVDHQVGPRRLGLERVEDLLVEMQLVPFEGQAREQRVFFEQEIADGEAAEQVQLRELAQLGDPLEEEEQLCRQREPGHVLVEARQERVLLGVLQHQVRLQPGGEASCEAGLADAYRPFDDDVVVSGKRHGSGARDKRRPSYTRKRESQVRKMKYTAPMMHRAAQR